SSERCDRPRNPAVEDQATDRAHRIGQDRPVTVYRLIARGTIEDKIIALHADRRALIAGVLEGTSAAARLTTRDLLARISSGPAPRRRPARRRARTAPRAAPAAGAVTAASRSGHRSERGTWSGTGASVLSLGDG